jgi:hypothetical protein
LRNNKGRDDAPGAGDHPRVPGPNHNEYRRPQPTLTPKQAPYLGINVDHLNYGVNEMGKISRMQGSTFYQRNNLN